MPSVSELIKIMFWHNKINIATKKSNNVTKSVIKK